MKSPTAANGDYIGMFRGCLLCNKRRAERRPYIVISVIFHANIFPPILQAFYHLFKDILIIPFADTVCQYSARYFFSYRFALKNRCFT